MTRMEKRMTAAEAAARQRARDAGALSRPQSRPQLAAATAALDRFTGLNAEILALSRRNTQCPLPGAVARRKGTLTAGCEDSLRALRDALAKRGFTATR